MDTAHVLEFINMLVSGGGTIEYAEKQARALYKDDDLVDRAVHELEALRRSVRRLGDPLVVENPQIIQPWYPGPLAGDIFWPAFRAKLIEEGFPESALDAQVDPSSSKIVSYLEPPGNPRVQTRGLVLGHVQSGKTTSFSAVIAKAADSGYRLFIILTGIHEALREQTHDRLKRQLIDPTEQNWFDLTHDGDFSGQAPASMILADDNRRVIAVVKKNPYRLRRLIRWLRAAPEEFSRTRALLVVDDEADQASIDVGKTRRSTINELILELLDRPKAAYLAYTATPFANLLIDPNAGNLYPKDFIVDLPQPEGHFGTQQFFGRLPITEDEDADDLDGLDVIRHIPDDEARILRPPARKDRREAWTPIVTASLAEALEYFVIATAARRVRGERSHSSMLVHTTMYADPQLEMQDPVREQLASLRDAWGGSDVEDRLRALWDREQNAVPPESVDCSPVSFEALKEYIPEVLGEIEVVVDNYRSTDRLAYGDEPRTVVAIGGNTLSRGLTLEGLVVSFFVRAASAYDTLLQMGRWFGFRPGYQDLPRIWMTAELHEWFIMLATVEAEIRNDIRRYEAEHRTPQELAVRIRTHPAMAVTARAKMRDAQRVTVSYADSRIQTILFHHTDREWLETNSDATRVLVREATAAGYAFVARPGRAGWWLAEDVPWEAVRGFLERYRFHEQSADLNSAAIIKYVDGQREQNSLHRWNVVIAGRLDRSLGDIDLGLSERVGLIRRSRMNIADLPHANIKALMSKVDRVADLPELDGVAAAKRDDELQQARPPRIGLLVIYPIAARSEPQQVAAGRQQARTALAAEADVIGVGLVFPRAEGNRLGEVEYIAAFGEPNVEDAEEIADEISQELDRMDEASDEGEP